MKRLILSLAFAAFPFPALAAEFDVEIHNPTRGLYFTPLLVAAHAESVTLFESGEAASSNLRAMAEVGDLSGLTNFLNAAGANIAENPASGLLAPGESTVTTINTGSAVANTQLSVVAMLLPTNDGFLALNSLTVPTEPGTYTYTLDAYDAGTEANNELRGSESVGQPGMPVPAELDSELGTNGTGAASTVEGYVHIHRGNLGDTNLSGGPSDIVSTLHRWLNPVALVTVTVK
ncbi:spondin domain-containing protein [Marinobacter sp. F4218]|uniref:spondin domain-containing protein n=1 Tax=Marinobacter sp. F4218 TaxID=2862868 RepID=UPI001C631E30|nr:spondin domain-containing protein [Marinobacter sp. F4218]MBW7470773.1 spondin domain-containing protein [Marinobacter sp. F4218]